MRCARFRQTGLAVSIALSPISTGTAGAQEVMFKPGEFTSSEICGACHQDIYRVWRDRSIHARTLNEAFLSAYRKANESTGGKTVSLCPTCHAPTTVLTKDYDLALPITREAITCDFCHSLKGVRIGNIEDPFDLDVGPVKRGPMKQPEPTAHKTVRSELHTSALLCGVCHEYRNPNGVDVLSTYSEWEAGPYPKSSVICQGCHMPLFKGELVETQKTRKQDRIFINLHEVPGGHSPDQLRRALRMDLMEVRREQERTLVRVELFNDGAGHMVPTGLPSRRIVLEASMTTPDGRVRQQERVYQKVIVDSEGMPIPAGGRLFTDAAAISSDNRIAPKERRVETFDFPVPRIQQAGLKLRLYYEYAPMEEPERLAQTEMLTIERSLARE